MVSTRRCRIFMLVPCRGGLLREKPTAAAVRAAAPYFFALRERRRQAKSDRRLSSPAPRPSSGRGRSGRLRDRLRAVSYRLLRASRLSGPMAPPTTQMTTEAQPFTAVRGGDQGGLKNLLSPQLATARRWVKKKVSPLFTSKVSRVQLVYRYVVEIYSRSGTARQRFESLFLTRGVPLTPFGTRHEQNYPTAGAMLSYVHREALRLASILDDLLLRDRVNIFLSGEYIVRRLYGLEEVLRLHGSKKELEDANWAAADAYDLPELVDRMPPPLLRAHAEARKRLRLSRRRRAVLKKWVRRADLASRFGERSLLTS